MGALLGLILALALPASALEPRVEADARLDLFGLLARLAGDPAAPKNPFSDEAAAAFASSASHPAVTGFAAMRATGFNLDSAAQYAVYLSSLPELSVLHPVPEFFSRAAGGRDKLEAWRKDAAAFAATPAFKDWEAATSPQREKMAQAVRDAQNGRDLGAPLQKLLGVKTWADWRVGVSAFYPNGGGASWILEEKAGLPDVFVAYGPFWDPKKKTFDGGGARAFGLGAWPEAAFTMAYAAYEACRPALAKDSPPCEGLNGLSSAEDCVESHWVHAIVTKLQLEAYGPYKKKEPRPQRKATRWDEGVAKALEAYSTDRAAYPDLFLATPLMAAPLREGGKAPVCSLIDPRRFQETVYARRLRYYLDARLRVRPDAALAKTRDELSLLTGEKK